MRRTATRTQVCRPAKRDKSKFTSDRLVKRSWKLSTKANFTTLGVVFGVRTYSHGASPRETGR